jgi:coproporphyrinogen III oxidase-like Fe-S oxidoreductase
LDLVGQLNSYLEFGVQSLIEKEFTAVNRPNKIEIIRKTIRQLKERNQSFEISLIYGLPNQTTESFKQSIDFLKFNGCKKITAYPLMLLRGTDLFFEKEKWEFKEKIIGKYQIPLVVESNSFNQKDWYQMREIANDLNNNHSYQS